MTEVEANHRWDDADMASVGSRKAGSGKRIGLAMLGIVGICGIAFVLYLDAQRRAPRDILASDEHFQPTTVKARPFEDETSKRDSRAEIVRLAPNPTPAAPIVDEDAKRRAEEARLAAERERLERDRLAKLEAEKWARLRSPLIVLDHEGEASKAGNSSATEAAKVDDDGSDANRRFLNAASARGVEVSRAVRLSRLDALLPQGTLIQGVLDVAVQSDLPGQMKAHTTGDVWSFDGSRVLLPRGTILFGEYRSGLSRGQTRIFVVWTRALRADGVSIALGSGGGDALGRAGMTGDVDRHFGERFGAAALLSIVGGGAQFLGALGSRAGQVTTIDSATGQTITSTQQTLASQGAQIGTQEVARTMTAMAQEALKESLSIPPTVHVDQGAEITVVVRRDLDFSGVEADAVKMEARRLARGGAPRSVPDVTPLPPVEPLEAQSAPVSARY